ncbi:hypothetical protein [Haloplanus aerogenes]|uniref:Uncharacterized protein n=1 Tax=Haloplanus aerogenes TaxID=660522 RepID=A0A3M0D9W9_9EURY|nr:hypothetical protein [Haloplanus aerogenes]AZH26343.1 hypothetical protein DU502_13640 [Haloplanus aerogenes]RMB18197.1 hypothetical protein ATH50_1647 [Haloplanus aerogenes]
MLRHTALLVALLVLVAGCAGTPSETATPTATDDPGTITTHADTTPTPPPTTYVSHYRAYEYEATPITDATMAREVARSPAEVEADVAWRAASFTRDLFADGRAVRVAIDDPTPEATPGPFENGTVVRSNGTYSEMAKRVVGRHEGPAYEMRLHGPIREGREAYARADREAVNLSALSSVDRRVFTYALPPPRARDSGVVSAGYTWVFPADAAPSDSVLTDGDPHYVRYDGDLFRIEGERRGQPAVRYRVEYSLRQVADSAAAFVDTRRDSLVTPVVRTNGSVPDPAASVVFAALSGERVSWEGTETAPPRYRAAETWIYDHSPSGRTAYVRYDGQLYRLRVSKVVA